ncbi:MAG: hypothetical protein M1816_007642 [Peltula sp. TS41687]|nr:MAG: hypothetical protein M1816_007642 [Peltula sp. TS41687]
MSAPNGHAFIHGDGTLPNQLGASTVLEQHQHHLTKKLLANTPGSTQLMSPSTTLGSSDPRRISQMAHSRPQNSSHMNGRTLPSPEVTEETIDDAYVAFILYCNPTVSPSVDTTGLRGGFRSPPKSDGKSFDTYKLFELIRKLEKKEIKSWSQLALSLGVEPPNAEKKQSAQKVQQYAVRLKRWMHAMHLDAFFNYCIGKPHTYYTQVPMGRDSPEPSRDGVALEEDLALRALHPESRPKRGRKKAEDKDDESQSPAKRQRIDTPLGSADFEGFGPEATDLFATTTVPSNGHNEDTDPYGTRSFDMPWTTTGTPNPLTAGTINTSLTAPSPSNRDNSGKFGGQQFRWRLNTHQDASNTPTTPYPHSAITPATTHHLADTVLTEPMSAIAPGSSGKKGKSRKKHGPVVSSAWSSGSKTATGKFRGRPPTNRSIRDGPYTTFPANPKTREGPVIDVQRPSQTSTPVTARGEGGPNQLERQIAAQTVSVGQKGKAKRGGGGLQLQVPERSGGLVRLATPGAGLVNGGGGAENGGTGTGAAFVPVPTNSSDYGEGESDTESFLTQHRDQPITTTGTGTTSSAHQEAELVRYLAQRLSHTVFVMGNPRADRGLGLGLARRLAETAVANLKYAYKASLDEDSFIADCALWLGLSEDLEVRYGTRSTMSDLRVGVVPADSTGFGGLDTSVDLTQHGAAVASAATVGGRSNGETNNNKKGAAAAAEKTHQKLIMTWKLNFGPLSANLCLPVSLSPHTNNTTINEQGGLQMASALSATTSNTTEGVGGVGAVGAAAGVGGGDEQHWKEKYFRLQQEKEEEVMKMRRAVLKACF